MGLTRDNGQQAHMFCMQCAKQSTQGGGGVCVCIPVASHSVHSPGLGCLSRHNEAVVQHWQAAQGRASQHRPRAGRIAPSGLPANIPMLNTFPLAVAVTVVLLPIMLLL